MSAHGWIIVGTKGMMQFSDQETGRV